MLFECYESNEYKKLHQISQLTILLALREEGLLFVPCNYVDIKRQIPKIDCITEKVFHIIPTIY